MTLADVSIKNPVFAWMIMFALMIFGFIGYSRMGVGQLPDVDFPVVTVNTSWQGAAPEVMETDIVDIVEDAVEGVQGVRDVSSSITQGAASTSIEFELDRNIDAAVQDVQTKIAQAQRYLPKDMDPPVVVKVNPEDQPIMFISVTGGDSVRDLMVYVESDLKDRFAGIEGVGDIILGGLIDPNLRIWVDDAKLKKYQLTADDVITAVTQQHMETPAGSVQTPTTETNVRIMGEAKTTQDFENLVIGRRSGGLPVFKNIRLKDVANIEMGVNDIDFLAETNGERSVGIGIRKQRGVNEVGVAKRVLARLEEIKKTVPPNIQLNVAFNRSKFIQDSIRELTFTLLLSALVTSLICWIFLGSLSATLNILLAIPTSILGTFLVIYFWGFTLNYFTVLALTLSVGIVVDDAIMVLENIVRYRENKFGKVEAARLGARQITFAALAATLALIAIFLPIAFMTGIIGKFFYQYGVTISIAVAISLFEALTLTPMRCSQFLKVSERVTFFGKAVESSFKFVAEAYRKGIRRVLRYRIIVLAVTISFFVLSLGLFKYIRKEFVPPQDQSNFGIRFKTPVNSSLEYTHTIVKEMEKYLNSRPEVDHYFAVIGGFTGGQANTGFMFVSLKDPDKRPVVPPYKHRPSQADIMVLFRQDLNKIKDVQVIIQDFSLAGFSATRGFPIEFYIRGRDWVSLAQYSQQIMDRMKTSGLMVDVDTDFEDLAPEIHIIPDRVKAANRGVSVDVIAETINALIGGTPISKYTEGSQRYDVRIRLLSSQRMNLEDINRLQVWNNRGELVSLRDVVTIKQELEAPILTRKNRQRAISIFANTAPGKSQTDAIAKVQEIAKAVLPPGYAAVVTGTAQTFQESFLSLLMVLLMGILVSYMVLGSQFNSYQQPFYILLALPFSITGAFITLWATNQSFNIYSFIGVILLMGIVKKNSILLVDFTNHYRVEEGLGVEDALEKACPVRLRPILMTSLATVVAAIPPALAIGPGAEARRPMALAVIGGVFFSTMITLFAVPCAYSLFAKFEHKKYTKSTETVLPEIKS